MTNLGFLASGEGTSVEFLVREIQSERLTGYSPKIALCNKPEGKGGVYRLRNLGLLVEQTQDETMLDQLKNNEVDLVLGLGYLRKIPLEVLNFYRGKIWNIHPSLLPKYGGQGMHGLKVHQAVISSGEIETGATIHIMNEEFDKGRILNQIRIPIFANESPEQLQKRVLQFEYLLMKTTLEAYRDGLIRT